MSIYLVHAPAMRCYKIGYAKAPKVRLSQLKVGCPTPLRLVAVIPGDRSNEAHIHKQFAESRLTGEWFKSTPALRALASAFTTKPRRIRHARRKLLKRRKRLKRMTLAEYLRENDLTETALAAKLGVHQTTVHRACKPGHIPSMSLMAAIFEETGGKVRPDDFYGVAA